MKRSLWLVFGAYCVLSSVGWIITSFAEEGSFFEHQIILYVVVGTGAFLFAARRLRFSGNSMLWVRLAVAGVVFLGLPGCLMQWAGRGVSSISTSATFALLPVVVVLVTVIDRDGRDEGEGWGFLAPALAGFGGVLLLLPVSLPWSGSRQLMLAVVFVAVVLVAISGVWMHRLMQNVAMVEAIAIVCFANAAFLLVCGLAGRSLLWNWSGLTAILSLSTSADLIQIVLVFWLLREMSPVRFAARYLVIPLLTIVEGYVALRPEVTARMVVGAVLLAGGSVWILFSKASDDGVVLSLR